MNPSTPSGVHTTDASGRPSDVANRSVVYLWDSKANQVVCALRSRLAASGLTAMPRQSMVPEVATLRQRIVSLGSPTNASDHQEVLSMTQALQATTNILDLPEVCQDFFERAGCPIAQVTAFGGGGLTKDRIGRRTAGAKCHRVHVIGVDHTWRIILPTVHQSPTSVPRYGPGFAVQCYNGSRTQYYKIPSTFIAVTSGSEAFVDRFNVEGRHFHGEPFTACAEFAMSCLAPVTCQKGGQCNNIHVTIPTNPQMLHHALNDLAILEQNDHVRRDPNFLMREIEQSLQSVQCPQSAMQSAHRILDLVFGGTPSHIAADDAHNRYPRIGCNFVVRVYAPNFSADAETDYASEQVLITAGSLRYRNQMLSQRNDVALSSAAVEFYMGSHSNGGGNFHFPVLYPHQNIQKIQHCAHFKNKGICRNGQNCKFIHIIEGAPRHTQPQYAPHQFMQAPHPQAFATPMAFQQAPLAQPQYAMPQPHPQFFAAMPQPMPHVADPTNSAALQPPSAHPQQYPPQTAMFPSSDPNAPTFSSDAYNALGPNSQRVVVRTRTAQR